MLALLTFCNAFYLDEFDHVFTPANLHQSEEAADDRDSGNKNKVISVSPPLGGRNPSW